MVKQYQRQIRSYVRREGRITPGQQQALDLYWPKYGVDLTADSGSLNFAEVFGNDHAVILEIGFGMGDSLWAMAQAHPELNYFGIEVHRPGVGVLLAALEKHQIKNVRVCQLDAAEVIKQHISDGDLAGVQIFFPDPWPKKRHHKRRLIQEQFVEWIVKKINKGGFLHCATDWQGYAEQMMQVLSHIPNLVNTYGVGQYATDRCHRPRTKFEQRGINLGHQIWDLYFTVG